MSGNTEKKTITINPELFKVSSSKTRKNREKKDDAAAIPKLRIRGEHGKRKRDISTKNQVLKYIRQQQDQRYKSLMEQKAGEGGSSPKITIPTPEEKFDSDFKQSLDFLNSLAEKNKNKVGGVSVGMGEKQRTMKNHSAHTSPTSSTLSPSPSSLLYNNSVLQNAMEHNIEIAPSVRGGETITLRPPFQYPQYGCLKGGSLPTYRNWRQTQKNHIYPQSPQNTNIPIMNSEFPHTPSPSNHQGGALPEIQNNASSNGENVATSSPIHFPNINEPKEMSGGENETAQRIANLKKKFHSPDWMKRKAEMRSFQNKKEELKTQAKKPKIKRIKQKKTMRRTYRVGKSKYLPRVSVLVSNRTIRKQITEKSQKLKQIPIEEVRKTLIKKGFIKVGSIAPNDVLRKMYESISLLCGDIQNHNADNLVYNYFNYKDN